MMKGIPPAKKLGKQEIQAVVTRPERPVTFFPFKQGIHFHKNKCYKNSVINNVFFGLSLIYVFSNAVIYILTGSLFVILVFSLQKNIFIQNWNSRQLWRGKSLCFILPFLPHMRKNPQGRCSVEDILPRICRSWCIFAGPQKLKSSLPVPRRIHRLWRTAYSRCSLFCRFCGFRLPYRSWNTVQPPGILMEQSWLNVWGRPPRI